MTHQAPIASGEPLGFTHDIDPARRDRDRRDPSSPSPRRPDSARPDSARPDSVDRADRWTPPKMAAFLRQLSATHSVRTAARSVGMSRQSAYRLRSRLKGGAFDLAWDVAFHHSYDNLAHAALERALNGVEVPVFHRGEQVGSYRRYDERLTVALLSMTTARGNVPVLGRLAPEAERHAARFEALVGEVEAGLGEPDPLDDPGPAESGEIAQIWSAGVSPFTDEDLIAGLQGFGDDEAG